MSVRTKADELLTEVREEIKNSSDKLLVVLSSNTWGHDDFSDDFINAIHEAVLKLREVKKLLN